MDPNTTSAAYNPQIIEARKASLAEKLRRAIGLRRGVEETVQQQPHLTAKLRLRELAQRREIIDAQAQDDPASARAKSLIIAGGSGILANAAAGFGAGQLMNAKR